METTFAAAAPGRGHRALASLYRAGKIPAIVTQNIDNLHQASGFADDHVIELHGNTTYARCIGCGLTYDLGWVKQRFAKAKLVGVSNSGATAPLEDIMAKRADAAPINRVPWVAMNTKVKGLAVLPSANNCQDSTEKAQPVGLAIDKGQQALLDWLRAVEKSVHTKLEADEQTVIATMQ